MSAHVLMNLLKKFGKSGKMRCLPSILSLFRNKFNNKRAQMLTRFFLKHYDVHSNVAYIMTK